MKNLILAASLLMLSGYSLYAESRIVNNLNVPINLVFYGQNFKMPIPSVPAVAAVAAVPANGLTPAIPAIAASPAITGTAAAGRLISAPGTMLAAAQDIAIPTNINVAYVGAFTDNDSTYQQITVGKSYSISAMNGQLHILEIPNN